MAKTTYPFFRPPTALIDKASELGLVAQEIALVVVTLRYLRLSDATWPYCGTKKVAGHMGLKERAVRRLAAGMVARGLLERDDGPGRKARREWNWTGLWKALGIELPGGLNRSYKTVSPKPETVLQDRLNRSYSADMVAKNRSCTTDRRRSTHDEEARDEDLKASTEPVPAAMRVSNSRTWEGKAVAHSVRLTRKQQKAVEELQRTIGVWPSEGKKLVLDLGKRFKTDGVKEARVLAAYAGERDGLETPAAFWQAITRAIADGEADMPEHMIWPDEPEWTGIPCRV